MLNDSADFIWEEGVANGKEIVSVQLLLLLLCGRWHVGDYLWSRRELLVKPLHGNLWEVTHVYRLDLT